MSRANFAMFERSELSEFAANVNFSSLRNLASNELFFTSFISLQQPLYYIIIFYFKNKFGINNAIDSE